MKQLLLLTPFFLNEKTKVIRLKDVQLIYGSVESKTWEVWCHGSTMAGSTRTCIWVLRDTVNHYPKIIVPTYVPLFSDVLQTVHLQETLATTHFLAFLGPASELQRKQVLQAAHGEFCPSHHLNSWSKKIQRNRNDKCLCGEWNTTSHSFVNSPETICSTLTGATILIFCRISPGSLVYRKTDNSSATKQRIVMVVVGVWFCFWYISKNTRMGFLSCMSTSNAIFLSMASVSSTVKWEH